MGYDMYWLVKPDGEDLAVEAAQEEFTALVDIRDAFPSAERGTFSNELYQAARDAGRRVGIDDYEFYIGITSRYKAAVEAVHEAHANLSRARTSYFRFNVWGMGRALDVMAHTRMTFTDNDVPPFPALDDFDVTWDDIEAAEYDGNPDYAFSAKHFATMTAEAKARAKKYLAERGRVLSYHGKADTPGIPEHKFSSNDGWHVVPAECEAAARAYMGWLEQAGADNARNYVENTFGDFAYWNEWVAWISKAARYGGFRVR